MTEACDRMRKGGSAGSFLFHSHLPWSHESVPGTEAGRRWLYEALADSYLPLLNGMEKWQREGMPFRCVLSFSPPLIAMLSDDRLCDLFGNWLRRQIELSQMEIVRNSFQAPLKRLGQYYRDRYCQCLNAWESMGGDLRPTLRRLVLGGDLEMITTSATHALLPFLLNEPRQLEFQIRGGLGALHKWLDTRSRGFWLPECAWHPSLELILVNAGVRWVMIDDGSGRRPPVVTDNGLTVFFRNQSSARLIWDATSGYPTAPEYRDFYRDIGQDLDPDYLKPFLMDGNGRGYTGLKYHTIGGGYYDPESAQLRILRQAAQFIEQSRTWSDPCSDGASMDQELTDFHLMAFDTELFGHWWHEGPQFLDSLVKASAADTSSGWKWATPSGYLMRHSLNEEGESGSVDMVSEPIDVRSLAPSSWGSNRDFGFWIHDSNRAESMMVARDRQQFWEAIDHWLTLKSQFKTDDWQEMLELFCAGYCALALEESSDWLFMIRAGQVPEYGRRQINFYHNILRDITRRLSRKDGIPAGDRQSIIRLPYPLMLPSDWLETIVSTPRPTAPIQLDGN